MRRLCTRDDFSPRKTLSLLFARYPFATNFASEGKRKAGTVWGAHTPRPFSSAFIANRNGSLPKQAQTRQAFRRIPELVRPLYFRLAQKELVSGPPGDELFSRFEPLLLKSQSRTVFNALFFSSLLICLISPPRAQSMCHIVILAIPWSPRTATRTEHMPHRNSCHTLVPLYRRAHRAYTLPLFCSVWRVSITFDTYNFTV